MRRPICSLLLGVTAALLALGVDLPAQGAAPDTPAPLDVPFFSQDELLCGGASAAMLMRHWGDLSARPEMFSDLVDRERGGISGDALVRRLRTAGWRARAVAGDREVAARWIERGMPWMALIAPGQSRLHYVVVVAWSPTHVVIHDPAEGPSRRMERADFLDAWSESKHWALLVWPKEEAPPPPPDAPHRSFAPVSADPDVRKAVESAHGGRLDEARRLLRGALERDPDDAQAWSELAGVRFREQRWPEAAKAAARACDLRPADPLVRRLLAASLYMDGHALEALRQWNHLREPRVGFVEIEGARRTRYAVIEAALGVDRGKLLTPAAMQLARRRAEGVPSVQRARIEYRIQENGTALLRLHVLEKRRWPDLRALPLGQGARLIGRRSARGEVSNLTGGGDLWSLMVRPQGGRRAVSVSASTAGVLSPAWVMGVSGRWESETYDLAGRADRMTHRLVRARLDRWLSARWGLGFSLVLRRENDRRREMQSRFELRYQSLGDRLQARVGAEVVLAGGSGGSLPGAFTSVSWSSSTRREGLRLTARGGAVAVDARAQRWRWPGAGVGIARPHLLRAHPLLDDGVITGKAFAPHLIHGGVEVQRWLDPILAMRPGMALFVDTARVSGADAGRKQFIDVGVGIRWKLPGGTGTLSLDAAHGVRDGAQALSLSYQVE